MKSDRKKKMMLTTMEIVVFGMLGAIMYVTKIAMQVLPNIHLLGLFIVAMTVVYRGKALFPIYIYVFLEGLFAGFAPWWLPYLYIWTVLWGIVMLLPKKMNPKVARVVYIMVSALHGLLFGVMYAPAQAVMYGMTFDSTLAWIVSGLPYDCVHALGNVFTGILIMPLIMLLEKLGGKNKKDGSEKPNKITDAE